MYTYTFGSGPVPQGALQERQVLHQPCLPLCEIALVLLHSSTIVVPDPSKPLSQVVHIQVQLSGFPYPKVIFDVCVPVSSLLDVPECWVCLYPCHQGGLKMAWQLVASVGLSCKHTNFNRNIRNTQIN